MYFLLGKCHMKLECAVSTTEVYQLYFILHTTKPLKGYNMFCQGAKE